MRTSVLGGEIAGRGVLGRVDNRTGVALGVTALVAAFLWLAVGGAAGTVSGLGILASGVMVLYPWNGGRSWAAGWIRRGRFFFRRWRGTTTYTVGSEGTEPVLPPPVGRVAPLDLAGTPHEDMFVLRHDNPGEAPYLSVVIEIEGQPQRLRTIAEFEASSARYGVMLSQLARDGSFIRGLQQINRILPHDPARHRAFVAARIASRPGIEALVSSYEDLIDLTTYTSEQHRNYLVARFPLTGEFAAGARRYGQGETGWAGLVREELARLTELVGRADLVRPRVLGEQRTCAVLRSMQDPAFPVDQHEGVRWSNCWQGYQAEQGHVTVNDRWLHRVATVPPDSVAAVPLGPHWLAPLLVEVNPAVIRTLSVRMEFVPARVARARAVRDVAVDGASRRSAAAKGQVGDGTDEMLLSASRRRLDDLTPGGGHHGVVWTMALSVTAADAGELARASTRVANAAANCAIGRLEWQDTWHDAAAIVTYPLARGMAVTA
ncbi:SCO6880 family protein [Amycolatopsis sp. lyj-90]|uniref:SCO6880 family protein n=1 Tax=Amycolatopsis sp. lyj-90 TaxID=2789285 RepID=UPI00397E83C3